MSRITDAVFDWFGPIYFCVFAVAAYFQWRFLRQLRIKHPAEWQSVGSPSILNNSISNSLKFLNFLLRKKYAALRDPRLDFYGAGTRIGLLFVVAFLALYIIAAPAGLYLNGVFDQSAVVKGQPITQRDIAIFACIPLLLMSHYLFLSRLRGFHREKWEALGEPSLFNQGLSTSWKVTGFFLCGEYLKLRDAILNAWAATIWILFLGLLSAIWFGK